ncbi:carbohydrate ABC transporter permease [Streptomyces hokutonensis]|uniref:carbohydrate ABC transporter permease n=1 Tax=Streptomyces hokutonensis TaxID=1306990 RepID=UPI0038071C74
MTITAPRTRPASPVAADTAPLRRRRLRGIASHTGLLLVTLIVIAPILLMVKVSLQSDADVAAHPLSWPAHWNLHNYVAAIRAMNYGRSLYNTVLITGGAALLVMLTGSLAAWPMSRISRRWTKTVYQLFVAGLTVPVFVMITPLYMFMRDLQLLDTFASVILAEAAISLPFAVLFFTSFLKSVPVELEEAAAIDGAGPLRTYWHVILPVLRPATATLAITLTLAVWNDLVIPLVLLTSDSKQTMTLDVYSTIGTHAYSTSQLLPTVVLGTAPLLVVFVALQRHIVAGITAGVSKG